MDHRVKKANKIIIISYTNEGDDQAKAEIEAHGFTGEGDILINMFESVAHTAANMARNHNCDDPDCEVQTIATEMTNAFAELKTKLTK